MEFFRIKFAGSQADRKVKAEADEKKIAEQLKRTKIAGRNFYIYNSHSFEEFLGAELLFIARRMHD